MEATFDLLAKALRQKRQAMTNKKKQRGGRLETNAAKRGRRTEPAGKLQEGEPSSSTGEGEETDYNTEASPDQEISVIVAAANPDSIVPGAANRTMAGGFRATDDVVVPAYQEVRVDLDGQV